jgi:photosystem I P700 chlorophyll a apoprotein A2
MLNTIGWVTFYWHWKHITLVTNNLSLWTESSTYLMGWLRDYLWFNSSQLINGYSPLGVTKNAVWDWMFLFGHLIWATGFMFLISWRGYWQELIESIVWAHEQTPLANLIIWAEKPVALSIVLGSPGALTKVAAYYSVHDRDWRLVHNDVMQAFGTPEFEISLTPFLGFH